jgi:hypothetical protein
MRHKLTVTENKGDFKKGNKAAVGRAVNVKTHTLTSNIRELIRSKIDWQEKIEILDTMACGRFKIITGYGKPRFMPPSLQAMELLFLYAWGRPTAIEITEDDKQKLLHDYTQFIITQNIPPAQPLQVEQVSNNGHLVS